MVRPEKASRKIVAFLAAERPGGSMRRQAARRIDGQHYVFHVPGTGKLWRRVVWIAAGTLIVAALLAGEKSLFKLLAMNQEQRQLIEQAETLRQDNQRLAQQIVDLKSSSRVIERIAREELGMVRPDEIVYRFISESDVQEHKK